MKIQGKDIYLSTLERKDCRALWNDFEYDFNNPAEEFNPGHSEEKSDAWFDDIQKSQGNSHIRLGIFLNDGTIVGDIALQDIDRKNRKCTIGMGFAKTSSRSKGYGKQAVLLMLALGFKYIGMERISENTLEINLGAQKCLEKCGFILEGRERKAVYLNGEKYDRMCYSILKEEYFSEENRALFLADCFDLQ